MSRVAETSQRGVPGQVAKIAAAYMHESSVIAALEIDVGGIAEALVEDHRHPVGGADRWNCSDIAILEQQAGGMMGVIRVT